MFDTLPGWLPWLLMALLCTGLVGCWDDADRDAASMALAEAGALAQLLGLLGAPTLRVGQRVRHRGSGEAGLVTGVIVGRCWMCDAAGTTAIIGSPVIWRADGARAPRLAEADDLEPIVSRGGAGRAG